MRIPPPGPLRIDRKELLRVIRARLAERAGAAADRVGDPTDPAWQLIEESAWMVETLSAALDRYPAALLQEVVRVMGVELHPATPALGVVLPLPKRHGALEALEDSDPTVFLTPNTERRPSTRYVPLERGVGLLSATLTDWLQVSGGRLQRQSQRPEGLVARSGTWRRSESLNGQFIVFDLSEERAELLIPQLENAIHGLNARGVGWLRLTVAREAGAGLTLRAELSADHTLRRAEGSPTQVTADWIRLEGLAWRPEVVVADDPRLPAELRGVAPPMSDDGRSLVIPGVPVGFPLDELLVFCAEPAPLELAEAIWRNLKHRDNRLPSSCPPTRWRLGDRSGVGRWLAALAEPDDGALLRGPDCALIASRLHGPSPAGAQARLALAMERVFVVDVFLPTLAAFAVDADGAVTPLTTPSRPTWQLLLPANDDEPDQDTLLAWDLALPAGTVELVLKITDSVGAKSVMLNPLLVIQAPRVVDGRLVRVRDLRPLRVDLDFKDLVTDAVLRELEARDLSRCRVPALTTFKLVHLELRDAYDTEHPAATLHSWDKVRVEATEGWMMARAPGESGPLSTLLPGATFKLGWYRRTDGAAGVVAQDQITLFEQTVNETLPLVSVQNPYPTFAGRDRETPESCIERCFGPIEEAPLLPAEFEHDLRNRLGPTFKNWMVRVWSYGERALQDARSWGELPLLAKPENVSSPPSPVLATRAAHEAPPETLVISLGPRSGRTPDGLAQEAQRLTESWFRDRVRPRYAHLTGLSVVLARPVTVYADRDVLEEQEIPLYGLWPFYGRDWLQDAWGERRQVIPGVAMLDAAITVIRWPHQWPSDAPKPKVDRVK